MGLDTHTHTCTLFWDESLLFCLCPRPFFCLAFERALCCLFFSFQYSLFSCRLLPPLILPSTPTDSTNDGLLNDCCGADGWGCGRHRGG